MNILNHTNIDRLALKSLAFVIFCLFLTNAAFAAHNPNATLVPIWSGGGQTIDYTVTISSLPLDSDIDEVRIIKDPNYTNFTCEPHPGWNLIYVSPWFDPEYDDPSTVGILETTEMCWYFTTNPANNIPGGGFEHFEFSATVPETDGCQFKWKFETRDEESSTQGDWETTYAFTNIDSTDPDFEKTMSGPMQGDCPPGQGDTCWMNNVTTITVCSWDIGDETCENTVGTAPNTISGVEYCDFTLLLDDLPFDAWQVFDNAPGDTNITTGGICTEITFAEDSVHELSFTCYDKAGNHFDTDTEIFRVDKTPPETTHTLSEPRKDFEGITWIDGISTVSFDAFDPDPTGEGCAIGLDKTWYLNAIDLSERACLNEAEFCNEVIAPLANPYEETGCINEGQEWCTIYWEFDPAGAPTGYQSWHECVEDYAHNVCGVDPLWKLYDGTPFTKEESCHILQYYSVDHLGNEEAMNVDCFFVDKTPPTVIKNNGNAIWDDDEPMFMTPANEFGEFHWITTSMPIEIGCQDQLPHPSGDEEFCFKVSYDYPNWHYITDQYCGNYNGYMNNEDYCCIDASGITPTDFYFREESMHNLEYYCEDAVEKRSETHIQYYKVDNTAPTITKTMYGEDHLGFDATGALNELSCPPRPGMNDTCYVADNELNGVDIAVVDGGEICAVNDVRCHYDLWWDVEQPECEINGGTWMAIKCLIDSGEFGELGERIIFTEDSNHTLDIYCEDLLGNMSQDIGEVFLVDSTPPETEKTYGDPIKIEESCSFICTQQCMSLQIQNCYEDCLHNCTKWITSDTPITLTEFDEKVGTENTYYQVTLVPDDACYETHSCIPLNADQGGYAIGDNWTEYTGDFTIGEESCHLIEYYSIDKLGNEERVNWQCTFVDNTPPRVDKIVGDPVEDGVDLQAFPETEGLFHWVTQQTPITFDCIDEGPHPVQQETLCYKVSYDRAPTGYNTEQYCDEFSRDYNADTGYCCVYIGERFIPGAPFPDGVTNYMIHFMEDSVHDLEYYCEDHLGNKSMEELQYYKVDSTPPDTTKTYVPNAYIDPASGFEYIDTEHRVNLRAVDGGEICAIGIEEIQYRVSVPLADRFCEDCANWMTAFRPDMGPWQTYIDPFGIPEESCHVIEFKSIDGLGNTEEIDWQCVFVDKQPPITEKAYGTPIFPDDFSHPKWITSSTPITLTATDPDPHPSGVAETKYRVSLVADEYCEYDDELAWCTDAVGTGSWMNYESEFTIAEDSCHLIEYYSTDNVGKIEETHKQCVYVDNQPPTPHKVVDDPKDEWTPGENGDPVSIFYPEETQRCWNGEQDEMECWEVTTSTYISMDCTDPEPHPVNNEKVCFKVDFDGEDATERYCYGERDLLGNPGYGGSMEDGWCCTDHTIEDFQFWEESEHNLMYFCEDALGNRGPIDDEKFKVEGTKFEIPLFKKWNLISVPFELLNDSPERVFEEVEDELHSVWSFKEDGQWYVYHPNSPGTSTLGSIEPGYGYWVSMYDQNVLTLGGSLIGTGAPTMPPSRGLSEGWNLIGYYGTSWSLYKYVGMMDDWDWKCGDYWEEPDFSRWVYGDKTYCSLSSLVDTMQGYPKWDSLWSYLNCGDEGEHSFWIGHNACPQGEEEGNFNRMYAGRGYWVHLDEEEEYAPSTTCVWNDDQICYWTGGGILP